MADMFEIINQNAAAVAEADRREKARRAAIRARNAKRALTCRGVIAAVLILFFWLAAKLGIVHPAVSIVVVSVAAVWFAVWVGAWMQFAWAKWGLLR